MPFSGSILIPRWTLGFDGGLIINSLKRDTDSALVSELDRVADDPRDDLLESGIASYFVFEERLADRG